jgi:hypothetical protein
MSLSASEVISDVLVVVETALQAEGVEGALAAAVLEQVRAHFFGSAPPANASVASMAGGLIGSVVTALGGADQVRAILDAEYGAARAAVDAEAKAVLG